VLDVLAGQRLSGEDRGELVVDGVAVEPERVDAIDLRMDLAEAGEDGVGPSQRLDRLSGAAAGLERDAERRGRAAKRPSRPPSWGWFR
jgi:hypothetical protein